ncbi:hypothetical protein ABZP36_021026 [Zizania latifolia]
MLVGLGSFEWCLGVLDREDVRAPSLDDRHCNHRNLRRREYEDDKDGDHDHHQPRRHRAQSIWARIGHKDEVEVHQPLARGQSESWESGGHYHHASQSLTPKSSQWAPTTKPSERHVDQNLDFDFLAPSLVYISISDQNSTTGDRMDPMRIEACNVISLNLFGDQVLGSQPETLKTPPTQAGDLHNRLEDFLATVSAALPQPILPSPPKVQRATQVKTKLSASRRSARLAAKNPEGKSQSLLALQVLSKKLGLTDNSNESHAQKLATLFQHPLSPSALQAIKDLVTIGGGQAVLKEHNRQAASTSCQHAEA